MIEKKTVLILGAGASNEVGFPLGENLIREIYAFIRGTSEAYAKDIHGRNLRHSFSHSACLASLLNAAEAQEGNKGHYSEADINAFAADLWNSQLASIDDFLYK